MVASFIPICNICCWFIDPFIYNSNLHQILSYLLNIIGLMYNKFNRIKYDRRQINTYCRCIFAKSCHSETSLIHLSSNPSAIMDNLRFIFSCY